MFTGTMLDGYLANTPTSGSRQNRHKTVKLTIEVDLVEYLSTVTLKAAIVVVQLNSG